MKKQNLLALDYGTKKTGIAYSVEGFCFAWKTVPTKDLGGLLQKMAKEKHTESIIIGMPYNIDGSLSSHAKRIQKWMNDIQPTINIPIISHDERLSSSEARIGFAEIGITDGDIDAESARLILESYIEQK